LKSSFDVFSGHKGGAGESESSSEEEEIDDEFPDDD
jgi:hypothetical protein